MGIEYIQLGTLSYVCAKLALSSDQGTSGRLKNLWFALS